MPRKRKAAIDLTTEEAMKKLFPKKIIEAAKQVAHEKDNAGTKSRKSSQK